MKVTASRAMFASIGVWSDLFGYWMCTFSTVTRMSYTMMITTCTCIYNFIILKCEYKEKKKCNLSKRRVDVKLMPKICQNVKWLYMVKIKANVHAEDQWCSLHKVHPGPWESCIMYTKCIRSRVSLSTLDRPSLNSLWPWFTRNQHCQSAVN